MYSLIISLIVANCVLAVFNKDNDDDDETMFGEHLYDFHIHESHAVYSQQFPLRSEA